MGTEPTVPMPGGGEPGHFPPPTDPWSTPDLGPLSDPTADPGPAYMPPPQPSSGPFQPTSGPPQPTSGPPVGQPSPAGPRAADPFAPAGTPGAAGPFPPAGTPSGADPFPPGGMPGGDGTVVAQIGEIQVTSQLVHTPAGSFPLAGSNWQVNDFWQSTQKTPTWAVLAAIFGFCLLTVFSLLFLLFKETIYSGTVQVTVTNGRHQYVARIPVADQQQVQYVHQQVNYVRALAAL